jgi:hypothetical protein
MRVTSLAEWEIILKVTSMTSVEDFNTELRHRAQEKLREASELSETEVSRRTNLLLEAQIMLLTEIANKLI